MNHNRLATHLVAQQLQLASVQQMAMLFQQAKRPLAGLCLQMLQTVRDLGTCEELWSAVLEVDAFLSSPNLSARALAAANLSSLERQVHRQRVAL